MGKRLIQQRRGKGSIFRVPSHNYLDDIRYPLKTMKGSVVEIEHDPGRTGVLANIRDGDVSMWVLACEGMRVGQNIEIDDEAPVSIGNVLPLKRIPEGIPIYNIEIRRGDGGKIVRAAGSSAIITAHNRDKGTSVVRLPSGSFKEIKNDSRATVGVVAGGGRKDKPVLRAGKKHYMTKARGKAWPKVRGVAMNPIDHPHGGGSHNRVGKPSTVSRNAPPGRKVGRLSPKKRTNK